MTEEVTFPSHAKKSKNKINSRLSMSKHRLIFRSEEQTAKDNDFSEIYFIDVRDETSKAQVPYVASRHRQRTKNNFFHLHVNQELLLSHSGYLFVGLAEVGVTIKCPPPNRFPN